MRIIRNVTSNQTQDEIKIYGDEMHVYLNETITEETENDMAITIYSYDKVIVEHYAQYADPIEAATSYFNKADKEEQLNNIVVVTQSGKIFYGDPISRADIADAISMSTEQNQTSILWKLTTGCETVTLEELKEARTLALNRKAEIIGVTNG